ncbi:hypothetical protein KQ51_01365 [Candidatus Izimaplasma bacterium HR1]|jgi:hypothetical protein|uniref:GSU2403 family nucleotidyltransferase fold protein n=1 Tax=Candidatus Izimoplasma sp. HR1 TaxID=1541959 RepID=UPI0004F71573|nr:hypothetical protein KQ51_01365 [Candidatus Izimaplasma bacterium HR1]
MKISYEDKLLEIIKAFGESGILENVIVIGSWATYFYVKIFVGFIPSIRTLDFDCYIPKTKNIKVLKSVSETLKPINFDQVFDSGTEKSKFISPDGFEIEFLAKLKRNQNNIVKVDSLGVNAEQLGNLELFDKGFITVNFEGCNVKVASPSAYVLQKVLISGKRSEEKKLKDLESINLVYKEIEKDVVQLNQFKTIIASFGLKRQKAYRKYLNDNSVSFPEI